MKYYLLALKNYAVSDGRSTRRELIWFFVFHYLIIFILSFLDGFLGLYSTEISWDYGLLTTIYLLATICPTICLKVRRLHDIGKSGSWWWGGNIPILGFYVLYLYLKRGNPDKNEYGAPAHIGNDEEYITECKSCGYQRTTYFDACPKCGKYAKQYINLNENSPVDKYNAENISSFPDLDIDKMTPQEAAEYLVAEQIYRTRIRENQKAREEGVARYCTHCGKPLIVNSNFCGHCGTQVYRKNQNN